MQKSKLPVNIMIHLKLHSCTGTVPDYFGAWTRENYLPWSRISALGLDLGLVFLAEKAGVREYAECRSPGVPIVLKMPSFENAEFS